MIPKRIFQTFAHKSFEPQFQRFVDDWKIYNPDFEYLLWDDEECEQFIKNNFSSDVYDAYDRIIIPAFKADFWRYCVLYIHGGFYADIDTVCLSSFDGFINADIEFVTAIDLNIGDLEYHNLYNAFMGSVPKHPILEKCINRIVSIIKEGQIPPENLMNFTGPGCLGISTNQYLNRPSKAPMVNVNDRPTEVKMAKCDPRYFGPTPLVGNYSKVHLIKFEQFSQYVKDLNGKKILQNKDEVPFLKDCYNFECAKIKDYIKWGDFGFNDVPFEKIVKP